MISEESKKWIEAAKVLAEEPTKKVKCPECGQNDLQVKDIIDEKGKEIVERILYCTICGAKNFMRLKRPLE